MQPTPTAIRHFHFRDRRPPHEVQFALERELMTLLQPSLDQPQFAVHGSTKVGGIPVHVLLRLEAALPFTNCYLLQLEAAGKDLSFVPPNSGGKYLDGRLDLWCRNFQPAPAPQPGEGSAERASELTRQALAAESHLTDVHALQQEILAALRQGATYFTAHKEGGTNIRYHRGRFVRADYGESSQIDEFHDDAAFLSFLREFYNWETSRGSYPRKASEYEAWKLTLRLLKDRQ